MSSTPGGDQIAVDIVEPLVDAIELSRELDDLALGLAIDREVELAAQPVLRVLTVLTHHDHRRLRTRPCAARKCVPASSEGRARPSASLHEIGQVVPIDFNRGGSSWAMALVS